MDYEVKAESKLAGNDEVQAKNGLLYVMPQSLSSSLNKTFIRQQAQRSSYSPGETMVFDLNTGSRYIDPAKCMLMMDVSTDGIAQVTDTNYTPYNDELGAIALIEELHIHAKSGVELDRIQECNQYVHSKCKLKEGRLFWRQYASMWGGGTLDDGGGVPILGQNGSTANRVAIPMHLISGLFNPTVKGMKCPPGLLSGARVEITLEEFGRAFSAAAGTGNATTYTITNPIIVMMSHELTDNSQAVLNDESVDNGLEYTYTRVFTAVEPSTSNTLNIQVKKAVSMGMRAFATSVETANLTDQAQLSFSDGLVYSRYQYRVGSNFYPQQRIDTQTEGFYTTLDIYNKNETGGWFPSTMSYDNYLGNTIMGASFETDSGLNLTGVPINNSATLALEATVVAGGTSYTHFVFLEYVAVARSFLTNVEVKI